MIYSFSFKKFHLDFPPGINRGNVFRSKYFVPMQCSLYTRPSKLLNDAMGAVLVEFQIRFYFMYISFFVSSVFFRNVLLLLSIARLHKTLMMKQ